MPGIPPIGAGSAVAGGGYAGADIPVPSSPVAAIQNAAFYDPGTRTIPLNADGSAQEVHPVDQTVIFLLSNPLGSIPGAPTAGLDWDAILSAPDAKKLQTAKDRVNVCLATSIANGDVSVESVTLTDTAQNGALFVQALGLNVFYKNLRLPATKTPTAQKFTLPRAPTTVT